MIDTFAPALVATHEYTGEADWSARLAACGVLLLVFPQYRRNDPDAVRELLERALPKPLLDQRGMRERLRAEEIYRAMRAEWDRMKGVRYDRVVGAFIDPYPSYCVEPWRKRSEVLDTQPKRPVGDVELVGNRAVVRRQGHPTLVLEIEELTAEQRAIVRRQLEEVASERADVVRAG